MKECHGIPATTDLTSLAATKLATCRCWRSWIALAAPAGRADGCGSTQVLAKPAAKETPPDFALWFIARIAIKTQVLRFRSHTLRWNGWRNLCFGRENGELPCDQASSGEARPQRWCALMSRFHHHPTKSACAVHQPRRLFCIVDPLDCKDRLAALGSAAVPAALRLGAPPSRRHWSFFYPQIPQIAADFFAIGCLAVPGIFIAAPNVWARLWVEMRCHWRGPLTWGCEAFT